MWFFGFLHEVDGDPGVGWLPPAQEIEAKDGDGDNGNTTDNTANDGSYV